MELVGESRRFVVLEETDVLRARKAARDMAAAGGMDRIRVTEIEIAVSELGTNIVKHRAVRGEMVLAVLDDGGQAGFEISARDRGPGIPDPAAALRGGSSTAGTLGIGLSGVKRLMDEFTLESAGGRGTTITVRRWQPRPGSPFRYSVLTRPKPGETVNGDAYFIRHTRKGIFCAVIDALGHGVEAHRTAERALELLEICFREPLAEIVAACHEGLRHTRGVAMGLCSILSREQAVEHLAIGNVETRICRPEQVHTFCFNGTVGMQMERHQATIYPFRQGDRLIMFTDGISGKLEIPPRLLGRSPIDAATHIFENNRREYDDATVLVLE